MTYSLVFGESMLNDAVSIVSFKTLASFYSLPMTAANFFKAVGMFLLIFIGSTVIGFLIAGIVSLILRRTTIGSHTPLEIIFVIGGAYVSYFVPDALELSGIVSIFFYGLASRHYTYYTLSEVSQKGSHWIFEAIKETCETIVFCLLGITILQDHTAYNFYAVTMTCIGTLLARAIGIALLTFILNLCRPQSDRISFVSQIVMWNAGLRGAVAYALAVSSTMPKSDKKALIVTTIHASVIFTIAFHGILTAPIVWWTKISDVADRELSEPRPARKKLHNWWSHLDKTYIIPLISYARAPPQQVSDDPGQLQLQEMKSQHEEEPDNVAIRDTIHPADIPHDRFRQERDSIDVTRQIPANYDDRDENPNRLDTVLFEEEEEEENGSHSDQENPKVNKTRLTSSGSIHIHFPPSLARTASKVDDKKKDQ